MTLAVPVSTNDHIRGNPNALVTLIEYGDYECPLCAMAHPITHQLMQYFGYRLCFVFRHFPLMQSHPHAEMAAEAAEFAGAHGRFWEMHDAIYENQATLGLPLLLALARRLGMSDMAIGFAIANSEYAPKIQRDFLGGVRSGVNGTPTFFIGDRRHDGSWDYDSLVDAIGAQFETKSPRSRWPTRVQKSSPN
jgi:protein-disulfide isomerase